MVALPAPLPAAPLLPAARPVLKWAGGKQQLLPALLARLPARFERYIEPFFGGGALFFALAPRRAVIADLNPELIGLYAALATDVEAVIAALHGLETGEDAYYRERALDWRTLAPARAAARTLYLNRMCYNGLYRVNRRGEFNVPYGRHASPPRLRDPDRLRAAARVLAGAEILCADYRATLDRHARAGDVVFLDPPYLPVGPTADFKRYTATQFGEADHHALLPVVEDLRARGCHVLLTNANHPLVHELFGRWEITVLATRRMVSSRADRRRGEDVVVSIPPADRSKAG